MRVGAAQEGGIFEREEKLGRGALVDLSCCFGSGLGAAGVVEERTSRSEQFEWMAGFWEWYKVINRVQAGCSLLRVWWLYILV